MPNEDHRARSTTSRYLTVAGAVGVLVILAVLAVVLTRRDDGVEATSTAITPAAASTTSTTLDPRSEVVDRLRTILRLRDKAFRDRDAKVLDDIYTVDCPCLEGDRNAIRELRTNNYNVVGGDTSIKVRRVERVSGRMWLVIADFRSAPLRIEAPGNRLIREEPAGSDLFQFVLTKPADSSEWLLVRATVYRNR